MPFVFMVLVPVLWLVLTALPGFPGVSGPLWLLVTSAGMALSRVETPRG